MSQVGPDDALAAPEASLQERDALIVALRAELDETNRGVLALYTELDDKAAQLKEALDLKGRFLSYMSHEFRTPLSAVLSLMTWPDRDVAIAS